LATNVAETSVTVPGVGVVIDSGLVRRTRYHRGRGFLTLMAVAEDSAAQRAGRAGRTMPGTCLRLWQEAGRLETSTPPEIHRESLLPLVLGAAACGASVDTLAFLDPPADYAVAAAREEALALGALDASGTMTATGRDLFGLPLDPPLGRLLLEAKRRGTLPDAIDLVAALATGRPLFERSLGAPSDDPRDLRYACCDATALVLAVRRGRPGEDRLIAATLKEARSIARRLRRVMGLAGDPDRERPVDREALCRTALAADPRSAHVARERRRHVAWSNGGTEIELARESAAQHAERVEALVVFETRALAKSAMKTSILATCASPAPLPWFAAEGLGRERVARAKRQGDAYVVEVERVFARKVVATRRVVPEGPLARQAVAQLVMAGDLFGGILPSLRQRLDTQNLAARLATRGLVEGVDLPELDLAAWLEQQLAELGLEQMDDLALLTAEDLLPPELPWAVAQVLEREFPKEVRTREARYAVEIDVAQGEVTLRYLEGSRGQVPRKSALPAFVGFKVKVDTGRGMALVDR
ncbi:MAG: hypothetical protein KC731_18515, partial [Myxococcales bacterium]|nr:hypothetical protein [Myxococcales bacterium]